MRAHVAYPAWLVLLELLLECLCLVRRFVSSPLPVTFPIHGWVRTRILRLHGRHVGVWSGLIHEFNEIFDSLHGGLVFDFEGVPEGMEDRPV